MDRTGGRVDVLADDRSGGLADLRMEKERAGEWQADKPTGDVWQAGGWKEGLLSWKGWRGHRRTGGRAGGRKK